MSLSVYNIYGYLNKDTKHDTVYKLSFERDFNYLKFLVLIPQSLRQTVLK